MKKIIEHIKEVLLIAVGVSTFVGVTLFFGFGMIWLLKDVNPIIGVPMFGMVIAFVFICSLGVLAYFDEKK